MELGPSGGLLLSELKGDGAVQLEWRLFYGEVEAFGVSGSDEGAGVCGGLWLILGVSG